MLQALAIQASANARLDAQLSVRGPLTDQWVMKCGSVSSRASGSASMKILPAISIIANAFNRGSHVVAVDGLILRPLETLQLQRVRVNE
jgi:hypothetical protein